MAFLIETVDQFPNNIVIYRRNPGQVGHGWVHVPHHTHSETSRVPLILTFGSLVHDIIIPAEGAPSLILRYGHDERRSQILFGNKIGNQQPLNEAQIEFNEARIRIKVISDYESTLMRSIIANLDRLMGYFRE